MRFGGGGLIAQLSLALPAFAPLAVLSRVMPLFLSGGGRALRLFPESSNMCSFFEAC